MLIFFSINLVTLRIVRHRTNSESLTFVDSGQWVYEMEPSILLFYVETRYKSCDRFYILNQPVSGYELVYTE